jgi:hypothetical protein
MVRGVAAVRSALNRCVVEAHDFWTMYLVPGLPARLLPWRWAWACYHAVSRFPVVLSALFRSRAAIAQQVLPQQVELAPLIRRLRLLWLLDAADLYLAHRTPIDRAPGAHFKVEGEWPQGPFIAVSFHYGTGMWMLRDLHRKGRRTVVIAAPFEPGDYKGRRIYLAYGRMRHQEMEHSAGRLAAYRPRVREKLLAALAAGDIVMSLLDLPPRLVPANQRPVTFLDTPLSLPSGVIQLAAAANVPVVPFWVEIDAAGVRKLVIQPPRDARDTDANIAYFGNLLDTLIRRDPAAWHFWSEWPMWQRDAAALHTAGAISGRLADSALAAETPVSGTQSP